MQTARPGSTPDQGRQSSRTHRHVTGHARPHDGGKRASRIHHAGDESRLLHVHVHGQAPESREVHASQEDGCGDQGHRRLGISDLGRQPQARGHGRGPGIDQGAPCLAGGKTPLHKGIRQPTRPIRADECRQPGERCKESHFDHRVAARLDKIGGQPVQEQPPGVGDSRNRRSRAPTRPWNGSCIPHGYAGLRGLAGLDLSQIFARHALGVRRVARCCIAARRRPIQSPERHRDRTRFSS